MLDPKLDQDKLKKILAAEAERERKRQSGGIGSNGSGSGSSKSSSRKRKKPQYSRGEEDTEVSAERMEAYKLKKVRRDDPMAKAGLGDDGLLPMKK